MLVFFATYHRLLACYLATLNNITCPSNQQTNENFSFEKIEDFIRLEIII